MPQSQADEFGKKSLNDFLKANELELFLLSVTRAQGEELGRIRQEDQDQLYFAKGKDNKIFIVLQQKEGFLLKSLNMTNDK